MKKWLENYWYHYKWHTLIAAFFIVMITVMIVQSCSRKGSDIYIMYAGPEIISDDRREDITDAFAQLMPKDYDGDGKRRVELMDLIMMNHDELKAAYAGGVSQYVLNEQTVENNRETLSVQAMAGDYIIFIIDTEWYKDLHNAKAFVTHDELKELGFPSVEGAKAYDDCAYYLNSLPFAKFFSCFEGFQSDTLICVRRMTTAANVKGKSRTKAAYDRHLEYYKAVLEFTLPEGYEPESEQ